MKNYLKTNWILLIILLVLVSVLYSKCENEKILSSNLDTLKVKVNTYKLKDGQVVTTSKTTTYDKVPEKTELTKQFQKVKTVIKIVETVRIDTVNVVYHDTIPCNFERTGTVLNKDYSLDYKSTQKGLSISNLNVPDSLEIVSGTKRKWFLGKQVNTIDITHSNKHVETNNIQHFEIKAKKKIYETDLFKAGVGFILGALMSK